MNNNSNPHDVFKQGIQSFQVQKYKELEKYYISETIKLSIITGPLYCLSANMQYLNQSNAQGKKITKFNSFFSLFGEKKTSYLSNLPFRPCYFNGYKECLFNLYRQSAYGLGFYKGNGCRLLFFTTTNRLKKFVDYELTRFVNINKTIREFILYSFVDILLNPLLFLESRYSIQNRRKGFSVYSSVFDTIKKSGRELYLGASYSIPRNFLFILGLNLYFIYPNQYLQAISVILAHLISYPVLTVQRNKIYHSQVIDYFPNYDRSQSMYKHLVSNYGFFSLYRGFFSYVLATSIWHYFVPRMAKIKFYKNALDGKKSDDVFKIDFFEDDEEDE